jgi:hypothetical protein
MKLALTYAALVLALAFTVTGVLYFTGPTTKDLSERIWRDRHCQEYQAVYGRSMTDPRNCLSWVNEGYTKRTVTVRTNAWERIAGAITGSGNLD